MKKFLSWIPYIIAQSFLFFIIIHINIEYKIPDGEGYYIGFLIATYGFLLLLSADLRRWYNKKTGNNK